LRSDEVNKKKNAQNEKGTFLKKKKKGQWAAWVNTVDNDKKKCNKNKKQKTDEIGGLPWRGEKKRAWCVVNRGGNESSIKD